VGTVLDHLDQIAIATEMERLTEPAAVSETTPSLVRALEPRIPAGSSIVDFPVAAILDNAWNDEYFGADSPKDDADFDASADAIGIRTPITLVGDNCALARGTLIGGRRRTGWARRRGQAFLPAILLHGLSADEILERLIADNLAAARVRRLSPSRLYKLEAKRAEVVARSQGQRSDLLGVEKGETTAIVAKELGQKPNAVKTRKAIFASKVAPESLKKIVDEGKVSLAKAAKIVRELDKAHAKGASAEECEVLAQAALVTPSPRSAKKPPHSPSIKQSEAASPPPTISTDTAKETSVTALPAEPQKTPAAAPKPRPSEICHSAFKLLTSILWASLPAGAPRPRSFEECRSVLEEVGRPLPDSYWSTLDVIAGLVGSFTAIEKAAALEETSDASSKPGGGAS
jgi:hypothetical protein